MSLFINILAIVSIGTCLYIHDPALSAAYGIYILYSMYSAVEESKKRFKAIETVKTMAKYGIAEERSKELLEAFEDDKDDSGTLQ